MNIIPILMQVAAPAGCTLNAVNINNWIEINALVVVLFLGISSIIYAFSNLLPNRMSERIKSIVRAEYTQGLISILLIVSLVSIAYAGCNIGASLSGQPNYQNVFQSDTYYIGTLMFSKGTAIISQMITQGALLSIDGHIATIILQQVTRSINTGKSGPFSGTGGIGISGTLGGAELNSTYGGDISGVYESYANTYVIYSGLVVISFGVLFLMFFLLPIISMLAFNLVLPVAILMRALAFAGPKLREAANALIALSIALYFVLPLALMMNGYIISWIYCSNGLSVCNPYVQYVGPYKLDTLTVPTLLQQSNYSFFNLGSGSIGLPTNFFSIIVSGTGGIVNTVTNLATGLVSLPTQVASSTQLVGEYLFESIVLIAIDLAITMGFAQGLYKALNSIDGVLGSGSFWD